MAIAFAREGADVLVNNAGYQVSQDGGLDGITTEQFDQIMKSSSTRS